MNEQTNPEILPDEPEDGEASLPSSRPSPLGEGELAPSPLGDGRGDGEGGGAGQAFDITHVKRVLEAALLSSTEPLTVQQLKRLFGGQVDADNLRKVLDELKGEWSERSIELTAVASGWRFRVKPEYQEFIDRIASEKPPRYSRAVLETLAIIAYRQPVTRGDIEDVRGVAVSPPTLKALEERGWIETVGHRETPGRPALFATTRKFLDDLNLRSLEELPPLEELQSALEPAPTLVAIEAASAPHPQDSLIDETEPNESTEQQEPEAHAG
jgi:segregation and condensation protein B